MWACMLLLYPELWEKFGAKMPSYEELETEGFPKDTTSEHFMKWMDNREDDEFEVYEKNPRSPLDKDIDLKYLMEDFLNSIEDKKSNYLCNILVHGYVFTGNKPDDRTVYGEVLPYGESLYDLVEEY